MTNSAKATRVDLLVIYVESSAEAWEILNDGEEKFDGLLFYVADSPAPSLVLDEE